MNKIILASKSPRRRELMALLPWSFEVYTKEVEEQIEDNLSVRENVEKLALIKAQAVAEEKPYIIIGADTVVCLEGRVMGKPKSELEAREMLSELSGRWHSVFTGVAIIEANCNKVKTFSIETKVKMQVLSEQEIIDYIKTKEPMDKAGSYGIQGYGAVFIEQIKGDYTNVVGLPVHSVYSELKSMMR